MNTPIIYKCEKCGNIVEMLHVGPGTLYCCGEPMKQIEENVTDAAQEKHVPEVEVTEGKIKVKVGSVLHPMSEKHLIEWIELIVDGKIYRKELTATDTPEAEFEIKADHFVVRAFCNLHGLWKFEK